MLNREIAKENLSLIKSIFDEHNILFWLAWGTCLGAIREQHFIADDDDIDLDVYLKDSQRVIDLIPVFKSHGFEIIPWLHVGVQLLRKNIQIDIFFANPIKKQAEIIAWVTAGEKLEGDFFSELEMIEFLNETYLVPKNPTNYLYYAYGASWQQKIKYFWDYKTPDQTGYDANLNLISLNQENCSETLKIFKEVLDRNQIHFWLAKTSCIEALLPEPLNNKNTLIFIGTYLKNQTQILNLIDQLINQNFILIKGSYLKNQKTVLSRYNTMIEIEYYTSVTEVIDKLKGYAWKSKSEQFFQDFFSELTSVQIAQKKYYLPKLPQQYLNYLYGEEFWQYPGFTQFNLNQRLDLLAERLVQQPVNLRVNNIWLMERITNYHSLIRYGDRITVQKLNYAISEEMIVLVRYQAEVAIKRVIKINADGKICLSSDFEFVKPIWLTDKDILGQVIALHTRWGLVIPLTGRVVRFILKIIMPLINFSLSYYVKNQLF